MWDRYFRNPLPDNPSAMLLREYPAWAKLDSKSFGPNFNEIQKFVKSECGGIVIWQEDDPFSSGADSHATLYFADSLDMIQFELRFGALTV